MDVDFEKRLIYINEPEKGSETSVYRVSEKCIKMLENLPRKGERIFSTLQSLRVNFTSQRARLAYKLGNPRFKQIHFYTFRHWRGTLEAYRVPNAFHVQKFLRHKNVGNTQKYVHWAETVYGVYSEDEFEVATAKTLEEFIKLLEVGYQYVADYEGVKVLRKRK